MGYCRRPTSQVDLEDGRLGIEQKLIDIVREQRAIPDGALTRATLLSETGLDSLDTLTILFNIEDSFNISIPDERARALKTFGDMIDVVVSLVPPAQ